MKQVFSSHSQVAHVWAQQTQSSGRANNMFFEGDTIFSYGYHYRIAKIHTRKGERFALVNSKGYSNSTAKHTNRTVNALAGLMPYFYSPDVSSTKEAVKQYDDAARASIGEALRRVKVTSQNDIAWMIGRVADAFDDANKLRKFLGKPKITPKAGSMAKVYDHLEARLKRYHELNTPEMVAKRARKAELARLKAQREEELKLELSISKFRAGEDRAWVLTKLPFELLRVKGDTVETSRGAEVPLREAKLLFKALTSGAKLKGKKIGDFTVMAVNPIDNDAVVTIGCHKILVSEAARVLDGVDAKLQLIQGGAA